MLKVLQYSWAFTALVCLGIGIFNFIQINSFEQKVYMPLIVSLCSVGLFFVMKSQVKSKDMASKNKKQ